MSEAPMSKTPLPKTLAECQALIAQQQATIAQQQATIAQQQAIIAQQQATIAQQQATIAQQQATIDEQQRQLRALHNDVTLLKRALFGRRRERFEDPRQGQLFDASELGASPNEQDDQQGDEDAVPNPATVADKSSTPSRRTRRRGRVRRVIPECLPRVQRIRQLDEDDIPPELRDQAAQSGAGQGSGVRRFLKKAGEWIEWQPPQLFVVEEYVEVLAVDNDQATQTTMLAAPREPRILNCLAGPGLLANLVVSRFADHQPYYRLEEILLRSGVRIDRSTQCRWMIRLAEAVRPLVERMRRLALGSSVVQADETSVDLLVPGQGRASSSYLWAVLGDRQHPYTTFYFTPDRSRAGPDAFFADFEGVLLSDAYVCYELTGADSQGRIRLAGCHAHARRKFEELHHLGPTERTATALGYFQRLFLIEDELQGLSDEERHQQRQCRSRPLLEEFKGWLDKQLAVLRPKHELRGAIEYMTRRWDCFARFLESGAIPIHNNATEQAVKLAVLGKKAWLFFGSTAGGEAAAVLYTLTASCRRLKIDPQAYLRDVFERLPCCDPADEAALDPLLPDCWLAEHPESRLQMRIDEAEEKAARQRTRRAARRRALAQAERAGR